MTADLVSVLDAARGKIGTSELPPGSNRQPFGVWYSQTFGGNWNGQPWCAMFVCWCLTQGGALDVGHFSYVPTGVAEYKAAGRFGTVPKIGAVVFYQWDESVPQHVGIVESINADGSIVAIEGNTSVSSQDNGGIVMRRNRKVGIVGYGYPSYAAAPTTPAPVAPANQYPTIRYGSTGPAVVKAQELLGFVTAEVDGVFGPRTQSGVMARQAAAKLPQTGVVDDVTWKALLGAPVPAQLAPARPAALVVDGQLGPATIARLQYVLNATAGARLPTDGVFGPDTRLALQRKLGVTADGVLGPATVTVLQRRVGSSPADGVWGTDTTSKLQVKLNAGNF